MSALEDEDGVDGAWERAMARAMRQDERDAEQRRREREDEQRAREQGAPSEGP